MRSDQQEEQNSHDALDDQLVFYSMAENESFDDWELLKS